MADVPIVSDLYPPGTENCHNVGRLDRNSEVRFLRALVVMGIGMASIHKRT